MVKDRCIEGLFSLQLALRKRPLIRYTKASLTTRYANQTVV